MTEFEEYLKGTFEINNGIENDVDTLVRIHAPELLKLAKKELMKDAIEVRINRDRLYNLKPIIHEKYLDYKIGDKVKIIIIKE